MNITFGINSPHTHLFSVQPLVPEEQGFLLPALSPAIKAARSRAQQRATLSVHIEDSDQQRHFAPRFNADLFLSSSVPLALVSQSPLFTGKRQ